MARATTSGNKHEASPAIAHSVMSMFARAFARSSAFKRAAIRRGGHGPASYNEPGGYLFNEKVSFLFRLKQPWLSN